MANYIRCRGTLDIYDKQALIVNKIIETCKKVSNRFGYNYIQTPVFEQTELFTRSSGETSDIVTKEMYTFLDKGNRSITLRPEGTAGVIRAVVENKLYANRDLPLKYYYDGSFFRYERPQAGRYREFMQFGVEVIGTSSILDDVETILLIADILKELDLNDYIIKINSFGNEECMRKFRDKIKNYLISFKDELCDDCKNRLQVNPLRVLDCKVDHDFFLNKDIPTAYSCLDDKCKEDFIKVQEILKNENIPFVVDNRLVRGLDYYTGLIFEVEIKDKEGRPYTVGGGGHYSNLVKQLSGPDYACVGFGLGINRLSLLLEEKENQIITKNKSIYIMPLCDDAYLKALAIAKMLRNEDNVVVVENAKKSVSSMFRYASKNEFDFAIVLGEDELKQEKVNIKNLKTTNQDLVSYDNIVNTIRG